MKSFRTSLILLLLFVASCDPSGEEGCIDESKISDGFCPAVYDPVCGCDGKTYGNECEAGRAGITSWTEGECGGT